LQKAGEGNMSEHKYAELAARLRADIRNGKYTQGERLPSENELAAQTGYSRQTVRQAMSVLENEGLTSRVQGSGTYVRSAVPRRLETKNIAVVTTYIGEYIFPTILHGIDHVLAQNGYTSMLAATRNRVDNERRILTDFLQKPIDGLIVEGTKTALPNPNIDLYAKFAEAGIPVVFINGYYPELSPRPLCVVEDDRGGGRMACDALLEKGCKSIAGIFKSDDVQGLRRYAGYSEALRAAELPVSDDHVLWYTTESRERLIAAEVADVVRGCDGLVCYNDEIAIQVIQELARQGGAVQPEIASFDDSTYAQLSAVPFLSLNGSHEKLGRLAAEKLLALLSGGTPRAEILPWILP
jgi:GntR family transcriptional regulator of arabinose operon